LFFQRRWTSFVAGNKSMKKNMDTYLERCWNGMVELLEQGLLTRFPGLSFRGLSEILGVPAECLDEFILEQVGISGAKLLDIYRENY